MGTQEWLPSPCTPAGRELPAGIFELVLRDDLCCEKLSETTGAAVSLLI